MSAEEVPDLQTIMEHAELLNRILMDPIKLPGANGRSEETTMFEIIIKQMAQQASQGNNMAARLVAGKHRQRYMRLVAQLDRLKGRKPKTAVRSPPGGVLEYPQYVDADVYLAMYSRGFTDEDQREIARLKVAHYARLGLPLPDEP